MDWPQNITKLEKGIYRTINGNSDEFIVVGRCIKAGFLCSKVEVTNSSYDAIIDRGDTKGLARIQIKGTGNGTVNFTGGGRSGVQILAGVKQKTYKYTSKHCEFIIAINSKNGDCYIIPIKDTEAWGKTKAISKLQEYKENWKLLKK